MSLDTDTVRRIARLARIKVPEDQLAPLGAELNNILGWVEQLGEVDTDGVRPMTSVADVRLKMREDVVDAGEDPDAVLENGPEVDEGFYVVPKVIE